MLATNSACRINGYPLTELISSGVNLFSSVVSFSLTRSNFQMRNFCLYLPQLSVPTVMVWGQQAQFTPLNLGQRLASLNLKAVLGFEAIADTGVLPHLEQPAVVIGFLRRYLAKFQMSPTGMRPGGERFRL
jgi:pimeloyl-ACP methyl ester carboxylesterase